MRRKTVITCVVTAAVCVLALLLPDLVLALHDRAVAARTESLEVDEVALDILSDLTVLQRLYLAGDPSATVIPLSSGKRMDAREAVELARKKVSMYFDEDLPAKATPQLRMGINGEGIILWDVEMTGEDWTLNVLMDDEYGDILGAAFVVKNVSIEDLVPRVDPLEPGMSREEVLIGYVWAHFLDFSEPLGIVVEEVITPAPNTMLVCFEGGVEVPVTVENLDGVYIRINM